MPTPGELARLAEQFDRAQWFDFLDEVDAVARRRRQREATEPDGPPANDRDTAAAWLAQQHFLVDVSIRAIWYLPHNAPPDEIRLLEVADRLAGPDVSQLGALDFGLDIEGSAFRLVVADATSEELERVQAKELALPEGWTLEQAIEWRRGQ